MSPSADIDLLNNFLNETQIAALNEIGIPVTVQAPISVAANVCGTTVNALGALRKENSPASCDATSGSAALAQIVQRQKLKQNRSATEFIVARMSPRPEHTAAGLVQSGVKIAGPTAAPFVGLVS